MKPLPLHGRSEPKWLNAGSWWRHARPAQIKPILHRWVWCDSKYPPTTPYTNHSAVLWSSPTSFPVDAEQRPVFGRPCGRGLAGALPMNCCQSDWIRLCIRQDPAEQDCSNHILVCSPRLAACTATGPAYFVLFHKFRLQRKLLMKIMICPFYPYPIPCPIVALPLTYLLQTNYLLRLCLVPHFECQNAL